ncbi:AAA family ATPase [Pseudomonas sp.]|uniref:AAA family ATPase n=1 Tax=Pseudomonas sp. TaxID=306 RepID=UPI003C748D9A
MKLNIKKLILENFKAFKNHQFEITSNNLVVLDGPNGFGKTSFFDAVELLLTGDIARYISLEADTIDRRSMVQGSPLTYDLALAGANVSITAKIETDEGVFHLKRSASKTDLDQGKGLGLKLFKLYTLSSSGEWSEVTHEKQFLEDLLGVGYQRNFKLFHYIEQEDNTAVLKSKGSTKQQKIDHLFDVGDYRIRIDKIEKAKELIAKLKTTVKKEDLQKRRLEIEQLRQSVSAGTVETPDVAFERLIEITQQPWDLAKIEAKPSIISTWLSEEGPLNRLKRFRHGASNFFDSRYNTAVDTALKPKPQAVDSLLRFGGRMDEIARYRDDVKRYDFSILLSSRLEAGFPTSLSGDFEFDPDTFNSFNFGLDYHKFSSAVASIKSSAASASLVELAYNELQSSRDTFITKFSNKHINHEDSDCPACGHDWETRENLLHQLELHRVTLESLVEANSKTLKISIDEFKQQIITPILKVLNEHITAQRNSAAYKKKIIALSEEQISYLKRLTQSYASFGINLNSFYCESFSLDETLKTKELDDAVGLLYRPVNYDSIGEDFQEIFEQIFLSDEKSVLAIEPDAIDRKSHYIKLAYIRNTYADIKEKELSLAQADETYRKAVYLTKAIDKLIGIYNENLNAYVASIAKGIEVLFHIYSGRLLQNFQSGLGIFIETDGKSLSFREHPKKLHDAIFSMSSGQLSSLVLSFTLALNKRYAKNTIMLIDDPVQSLDDINVAGFIDLLRNEFSDRQVILSTHEDEISSYMQYKFKKYTLDSESIDFKRALYI